MLPNVELILACHVWVSSLQKLVVTLVGLSSILSSFSLNFLGIHVCFLFNFRINCMTHLFPLLKKKKPDSCSFHICAGATLSLEIDLEPREVTQLVKCLPSITEALAL